MPNRRTLSLWFSSLLAERLLRREPQLADAAFVIAAQEQQMQVVTGLSERAASHGVKSGMALSEARALCPGLISRAADPQGEAAFLASLRRWAGRFSPWVSEEGTDALIADITGCAHLFGGEEGLATEIQADCTRLGLTVKVGIADTVGAAWAVARYAGAGVQNLRSGDAIDQEAPATRARAQKRRNWERGGRPPLPNLPGSAAPRIVPPGRVRATLGPLPITALRLEEDATHSLLRLGLRRIEDLATLPRATLARRAGQSVVHRLDQAFGAEPEPVSPARNPHHFATRLSFPDPIGLEDDVKAGIARLLGPLCERLEDAGRGARALRLTALRTDHGRQIVEINLARPSRDPARIAPLFSLKTREIDAGFGIDLLRLEAHVTEVMTPYQHSGHMDATNTITSGSDGFDDLVSRLGTRLGLEAVTRLHPADSHIPEKSATQMAAAFAPAVDNWPKPARPRPTRLFPPELVTPELVTPEDTAAPPTRFRWRRTRHTCAIALGPERLTPEWWLDDPNWRTGPRDYWRVETDDGLRLWLYEARGGEVDGGWFMQGEFG